MAAIGVYVGVNLMPGLNDTVATITTPTYSSGVAGLMAVVLIVFAAMNNIVASKSNLGRITGQIRGNLSLKRYGNPELNSEQSDKCVETRGSASLMDDGIVHPLLKNRDTGDSFHDSQGNEFIGLTVHNLANLIKGREIPAPSW